LAEFYQLAAAHTTEKSRLVRALGERQHTMHNPCPHMISKATSEDAN
jgi:hypothetical protein